MNPEKLVIGKNYKLRMRESCQGRATWKTEPVLVFKRK
jgi:hypothetical protein